MKERSKIDVTDGRSLGFGTEVRAFVFTRQLTASGVVVLGSYLYVPFILLHQLGGLYVVNQLPGVIALRVALPLDEILQLFLLPMTSVALDGLDFILFLVVDKVRWGPQVVFSIFFCLHVRG